MFIITGFFCNLFGFFNIGFFGIRPRGRFFASFASKHKAANGRIKSVWELLLIGVI